MNTKLPQSARGVIGSNEQVYYWCRRALYEVVEEFSQGLYFIIVWSLFVIDLAHGMWSANLYWLLAVNVVAVWYITYEFLRWRSEVHIVTSYENSSGGSYYKVEGVFNVSPQQIPIDKGSPDISKEKTLFYRLWGWVTGEKMVYVTLTSQGNSYIKSNRMPARFPTMVSDVRDEPAAGSKVSEESPIALIREIRQLVREGLMDESEGRHALRLLTIGRLGEYL